MYKCISGSARSLIFDLADIQKAEKAGKSTVSERTEVVTRSKGSTDTVKKNLLSNWNCLISNYWTYCLAITIFSGLSSHLSHTHADYAEHCNMM